LSREQGNDAQRAPDRTLMAPLLMLILAVLLMAVIVGNPLVLVYLAAGITVGATVYTRRRL
jgi:hypothetical protein